MENLKETSGENNSNLRTIYPKNCGNLIKESLGSTFTSSYIKGCTATE